MMYDFFCIKCKHSTDGNSYRAEAIVLKKPFKGF